MISTIVRQNPNSDQLNADGDGTGDACDDDGILDIVDEYLGNDGLPDTEQEGA